MIIPLKRLEVKCCDRLWPSEIGGLYWSTDFNLISDLCQVCISLDIDAIKAQTLRHFTITCNVSFVLTFCVYFWNCNWFGLIAEVWLAVVLQWKEVVMKHMLPVLDSRAFGEFLNFFEVYATVHTHKNFIQRSLHWTQYHDCGIMVCLLFIVWFNHVTFFGWRLCFYHLVVICLRTCSKVSFFDIKNKHASC